MPLVFIAYLIQGLDFLAFLAGNLIKSIQTNTNPVLNDLVKVCENSNMLELILKSQSSKQSDFVSRVSSISYLSEIIIDFIPKLNKHSKILDTDDKVLNI